MDSSPIVVRHNMLTYTISADGALSVSANVPHWPNAQALYDYCKANDVRAVFMLDGHDLDGDWWRVAEPGRCHATRPQGAKFDTVGRIVSHHLSKRAVWAYNVARDSRWAALLADTDPLAIWEAITDLERAMNRNVSYSPGAMALSLLTQSKLKHPEWYDCTAPYKIQRARVLGGDAHHIDPGAMQPGYGWLHVYDVNAAHLAAAQSVGLGCGTVEYREDGHGALAAGLPGVYHIPAPDRDGTPVRVQPYARKVGFYDYALARHAKENGYPIGGCHVYPEKHQALRRWAETVWDSREKVTGTAKALVKAGYTQALGRMGHRPADGFTDKEHRPLWYHAIVSEAGRRQWARWQLTQATEGVQPLFLWSDTIGVLTQRPIVARSCNTLGGLRHEGSYELAKHPDLCKLIASKSLVKALHYLGQEVAEDGSTE